MKPPLAGAISLPDGTLVRGRGRREPVPPGPLPDFGLYLGHAPDRARRTLLPRRTPWRPDWPAAWVDWPDFRIPRDAVEAAAAIVHAYELARTGTPVEIACTGGTGRTGTVIACMAVLAGYPADDAVPWTRRHYRPRAVETRGQRRWIAWFAAQHEERDASRRGL
ncbi:phosphatase domain-containing protein [Pseudonocardia nigra]|uniref:phosphatase domain-containing protein n=1 Tax=Pseudonocardia nigra TaxID=1921578 RepID=UPI0027E33BFB|nr:protein-tyrosine phosphatase family protein [Pseudonocardia nigra]